MTGFEQALRAHFGPDTGQPQYKVWFDYAASTNTRGAQVVEQLRALTPLRPGARLLDVGSGYGGVCIAAAKAGLRAVGVEIDPKLLALAQHNRTDHPELSVELLARDAMDWDSLASLGRFDLVTCDNVIEHVPNAPVLLSHLRRLLEPDGVLYLTAPNSRSFGQITSDCHYGQFGLSLLDPLDGEVYVRQRPGQAKYDVATYYSLADYQSLFARYGLHASVLNGTGDVEQEVAQVSQARERLAELARTAEVPAEVARKVQWLVAHHLATVDADLEFFRSLPRGEERDRFAHLLARTWLVELWYLAASPDPRRFAPSRPQGLGELLEVANTVGRRVVTAARRLRSAATPPR